MQSKKKLREAENSRHGWKWRKQVTMARTHVHADHGLRIVDRIFLRDGKCKKKGLAESSCIEESVPKYEISMSSKKRYRITYIILSLQNLISFFVFRE